ncbi:transposase [Micromonospora chokoriensis]
MRRGEQPPWIVSDELRAEIEPLLPPRPPRRRRYAGRKPLDDRKVLCGILFVLYTVIPWENLPQELGFGSRTTCWRRLRDCNDAGVWQRLHEVLLGRRRAASWTRRGR